MTKSAKSKKPAKKKAKKKAAKKNKGGRPTKYKAEYADQAYKLCLLGLTDAEMAPVFNVSEVTINAWKKAHPKFLKSVKDGKEIADADVGKKLLERAMGYSHPEEKIFLHEGNPVKVNTIKHYPPDATSMIFWLKNRSPENWRDTIKIDATVKTHEQALKELDE
jgi:hypothetical protein